MSTSVPSTVARPLNAFSNTFDDPGSAVDAARHLGCRVLHVNRAPHAEALAIDFDHSVVYRLRWSLSGIVQWWWVRWDTFDRITADN